MGSGSSHCLTPRLPSVAEYIFHSAHGLTVRCFFISYLNIILILPPASDPTEDQVLRYAGILMQQVFLNLHKAFHPILLRHAMKSETLNDWSQQAEKGKSLYQSSP